MYLVTACASSAPTPAAAITTIKGLTIAPGYHLEIFAEGFTGPTQMIMGLAGRLWVAQLNSEESTGRGQAVAGGGQHQEQTGLHNLQHLLVWTDGSVLVSEFATGTIYRITKEG